MSFLDSLNEMVSGVSPSGGFIPHPIGEFSGKVVDLVQREYEGRALWELTIQTQHGKVNYTIWGITDGDVQQAETDTDARDKILRNIGRTKQLFTDLKVASKDEVSKWGWSNGEQSILGQLKNLIDKTCLVVVRQSTKDKNKQVIFVNSSKDVQVNQPSFSPSNKTIAGESANLDNIPF